MVLPSGERLGNLGDPAEPDTNWWSESGIREVRALARRGQEGDERQKAGAEHDEIASPDTYRLLGPALISCGVVASRGSSSSSAMNW